MLCKAIGKLAHLKVQRTVIIMLVAAANVHALLMQADPKVWPGLRAIIAQLPLQ